MQSIIGGILLAIIGLLLILKPKGVWKVTESWKTAGNAGNSIMFERVARIVGAVCTAVGLLVCFGILR